MKHLYKKDPEVVIARRTLEFLKIDLEESLKETEDPTATDGLLLLDQLVDEDMFSLLCLIGADTDSLNIKFMKLEFVRRALLDYKQKYNQIQPNTTNFTTVI